MRIVIGRQAYEKIFGTTEGWTPTMELPEPCIRCRERMPRANTALCDECFNKADPRDEPDDGDRNLTGLNANRMRRL